jgi:AraC family transcriptional regulator of adaptative response/methylated-DNA-[protein]-cysteine methyltransferase
MKKTIRPSDFVTLSAASESVSDIHIMQYHSPFGPLFLAASAQGLTHALFGDAAAARARVLKTHPEASFVEKCDAHHQAALTHFENPMRPKRLSLALAGTPFQMQVWQALLDVPLASTTNYGALAKAIGKPKAARAVGSAVGKNPITFIVPCHRILAADGTLGGYYWGLNKKQQILDFEAAKY